MLKPSASIVTWIIFYVMMMGLVFAALGFAVGIYLLLTRPDEVLATSPLFTAAKLIFFFGFFPAYIYACIRGTSWLPTGIAAIVIALMWLDLAIFPPETELQKNLLFATILSVLVMGYGFIVAPIPGVHKAN